MQSRRQRTMVALAKAAEAIIDKAEQEGRGRTDAEDAEVRRLQDDLEQLRQEEALDQEVAAVGKHLGPADGQYPNAGDGGKGSIGGGAGWNKVAHALAVERKSKVEVPTSDLIGHKAVQPRGKDVTWAADYVQGEAARVPTMTVLGADARFLHPHLPQQQVSNELSISDFRQVGSRSVTGDVERQLTDASTPKAELDVEVDYVNTELAQVACLVSDVPNALLEASGALQAWLASELQYQLRKAIDDHVVTTILTTPHTYNAEGSGLITQLRNAVGEHREQGYNPTLAALARTEAAELDLTLTGGGYEFNTQGIGGSSPLWGLQVVEVADVVDPLLIDGPALGVLALGTTAIETDRSAGFKVNTTDIRAEASVRMLVRNGQAAFEVAIAS